MIHLLWFAIFNVEFIYSTFYCTRTYCTARLLPTKKSKTKKLSLFFSCSAIFERTHRCLCPTIRRLWLQKVDHCARSMEDDSLAAGQRNFTMPFARIRCIAIFLFQLFRHFFIVRLETWIFSFVKPGTTTHFRLLALPVHRSAFACRNVHITAAAISDNNVWCCRRLQFNLFAWIFGNKYHK